MKKEIKNLKKRSDIANKLSANIKSPTIDLIEVKPSSDEVKRNGFDNSIECSEKNLNWFTDLNGRLRDLVYKLTGKSGSDTEYSDTKYLEQLEDPCDCVLERLIEINTKYSIELGTYQKLITLLKECI
jgi:hypothetical protein